jgi:outer membrane immunogenic protein
MKKLFLASIAFITLNVGISALAADMPIKAPPVVRAAPPNWSGFYIGAHVGYGWGDFDFRDPFVKFNQPVLSLPGLILGVPLERSFNGNSFLAGLQGGVNAQFGSVVVGAEADVSWMRIDGSFRSTSSQLGGLITTSEGVSAKLNWLATLRTRLGWAFGSFLLYGTGGVAFGGVDAAGDITLTTTAPLTIPGIPPIPPGSLSLATSDQRTHTGWTAGAGIEGMITSNLSAKLEYLYTDLGWLKHEGPIGIGGTLAPFLPGLSLTGGGDFKVIVQTIKLGINYRFAVY